jgi:hypothetical protein
MKEVDNVLRILKETKIALQNEDALKLKELSDQTIHTASTTQDADNVSVAVIVYSLSKIIERKKYREYPSWRDFYKSTLDAINGSIISLSKNDEEKLRENLKGIRKAINKLSIKLKNYIKDVFTKAEINKASKIYEHGISLEKTASLLGITMFDLAQYAGQRQEISEAPLTKTMGVKERIKIAEDIFG